MNFLETVGLITLIGIGIFVFGEYAKKDNIEKKQKLENDMRAMYVSYRLALRYLYQQHQEPNIRQKLTKLAEHSYGGVSTIALDLNDSEYIRWLQEDNGGNNAYQQARSAIEKRGYPLSVDDGNVINRWGAGGNEVIA